MNSTSNQQHAHQIDGCLSAAEGIAVRDGVTSLKNLKIGDRPFGVVIFGTDHTRLNPVAQNGAGAGRHLPRRFSGRDKNDPPGAKGMILQRFFTAVSGSAARMAAEMIFSASCRILIKMPPFAKLGLFQYASSP